MYADKITDSMEYAIKETKRRRQIQDEYNKAHGIKPKTIVKNITNVITNEVEEKQSSKTKASDSINDINIDLLEEEMKKAAKELDFERAMELRDIIFELKSKN